MIAPLVVLAVADAAALALSWPGAVALHLSATLIAAGWWLWRGRPSAAPAILAVLGPVGLLAGMALSRTAGTSRRPPVGDDEPERAPVRTTAARLLDGRVRHAAPEALGSLVAIMRHADVPTRRRALETVVRSFEPALSPLVAMALTDPDQTIRALAAAASARIVANFGATRTSLEARVAAGEADARARLGALLADHARANVLFSDPQRATLRQEAAALSDDPGVRAATLWAAGDYAALDALVVAVPPGGTDDALAPIRGWWRPEPA